MKDWYVVVKSKFRLGVVFSDTVEASSAEAAAKKVGSGPVRLFYKGDDYWQFAGVSYIYEVKEL